MVLKLKEILHLKQLSDICDGARGKSVSRVNGENQWMVGRRSAAKREARAVGRPRNSSRGNREDVTDDYRATHGISASDRPQSRQSGYFCMHQEEGAVRKNENRTVERVAEAEKKPASRVCSARLGE